MDAIDYGSAQRIALGMLRLDRRVFPREKVDAERRRVFAELYAEGGAEALPPILLVNEPETGKHLVADGFTRVFAAADADLDHVLAVFPAVRGDAPPIENAWEIGLGAVGASGKPLSRVEQRAAILRLLDDHPDRSDAEIARLVGVTRQTVWRQRRIATAGIEGDQPTGERWATASTSADEIARKLVRGIGELWDTRGLSDLLLGDRTPRRLAAALDDHFGDDAEEWAERLQAWAQTALDELRRAE